MLHRIILLGVMLACVALGEGVGAAASDSVEVVSVSLTGVPAGRSGRPVISGDGRFVAFDSTSLNLVLGDTNSNFDVFVFDRQARQMERVSVTSVGGQLFSGEAPDITPDGRFVTFDSIVEGNYHIFIHDRQTGLTEEASVASDGTPGYGDSQFSSISADGRYVAFGSNAPNLVTDDTNGLTDVFVRDRQSGRTERVNVASGGAQTDGGAIFADISADGRIVSFISGATDLVPGDTNNKSDVFVHDRETGQNERVSVATDGSQADQSSGWRRNSLNADGRFVAFHSTATTLVPGDTNGKQDIFVRDQLLGHTERVSVATNGAQSDGDSEEPSISPDGRYVTFSSYATNLVAGDTNNKEDVFIHDRQTGETRRVSLSVTGAEGTGDSGVYDGGSVSSDGRFVAFPSLAGNLVPGDANGNSDVFVADAQGQLQPPVGGLAEVGEAAYAASGHNGASSLAAAAITALVAVLGAGMWRVRKRTTGRK